MTDKEARVRVAKGASYLYMVRPEWFNGIDTGTLTLHDPCGCIIGQLIGNSEFEYEQLGMTALTVVSLGCELEVEEYARIRGFDMNDPNRRAAFQPLQDAWIEAIADRRLNGTSEQPVSVAAVRLSVDQPVVSTRV